MNALLTVPEFVSTFLNDDQKNKWSQIVSDAPIADARSFGKDCATVFKDLFDSYRKLRSLYESGGKMTDAQWNDYHNLDKFFCTMFEVADSPMSGEFRMGFLGGA